MGWTHDYRDAPSGRGSEAAAAANAALSVSERSGSGPVQGHDPNIVGIPRIIRRRARWVSARLRHPRSR
ncbi:hypothetical protein [Streptomyces botrytidirepellens]|uniref:Uncharacterized protein n=1 Tax=Streptomyces botrytidirepellens TaxID=2486417 RepID=A0A3M8XAZ0_9ACTN|nr:hypothetical protein [Streptomyces botrytidirepellens]RNG38131.1 hypothetical protein EEJ42_01830 [Streptomyces botrytidirepellens]